MPHEAEAEIAGGLRVVAGQNAEAAGGDGQRFVKAELGGEIGDRILCAGPARACAPQVFLSLR